MTEHQNENMPLRFGSAEDYARVVRTLTDADFTQETLCRTLKLDRMSNLNSTHSQNTDFSVIPPRLALFIRLFLFFQTATRLEMELLLGQEAIDSFLTLDLLRPSDETASEYHASVFLYPVGGFHVTSDRMVDPDGVVRTPHDWVLPAIYDGTLTFLGLLAATPSDEALDLCSGTGIGAMVLSRSAGTAVAVDITSRASHYACFNKALNHLDNVEIIEGDLYGAVPGKTFDRIIAHPPYVPMLSTRMIYRDGGRTGEFLVRQIIEGVPEHLRPGGTYFSLSLNIDTREEAFEMRVRRWLGETEKEFDIVFAVKEERPLEDILQSLSAKEEADEPEDLTPLRQALEEIGATRYVYGALVVRRRTPEERHTPRTLRTPMTDDTTSARLETSLMQI